MIHSPVIKLVTNRVSEITDGTVTVPGSEYGGLHCYDSLLILINVTAAGTATGTVNIRIQDSWDGGTSWDDIVSSLQLTLGSTTGTQRFVIQGQIAAATITTATSTALTMGSPVVNGTLAAGSARQGPFGDRIRVRETVASTSGTPVGATYSITVIPKRSENN